MNLYHNHDSYQRVNKTSRDVNKNIAHTQHRDVPVKLNFVTLVDTMGHARPDRKSVQSVLI